MFDCVPFDEPVEKNTHILKTNQLFIRGAQFALIGLFMGWSAFVLGIAVRSATDNTPGSIHKTENGADLKIGFALPSAIHRSSFCPAATARPARLATEEVLKLIEASARKHHMPAAFVRSIVAAESAFNSEAVSSKGAIGLMQLMPETAKEYGADPSVPDQNIDAGTRYLKVLLNKYRSDPDPLSRTIAAYNAGPGVVDRYDGVPPFRETRNYVVRVMAFMRQFRIAEKNTRNNG